MVERAVQGPLRTGSEESVDSVTDRTTRRYPERAAEVYVVAEPHHAVATTNVVALGLPPNRVLGSLAPAAYKALLPYFEDVALIPGQVLHRQGARPSHVYFPESGILTLSRHSRTGEQIGIGLVGSEGMVGSGTLSSSAASPTECTVQLRGTAKRISVETFDAAARADLSVRSLGHVTACYAELRHDDSLQSVVCQSLHTVLQRCARWMLMMDDRVTADQGARTAFQLTHSTLAEILGVRRAGVTVAAGLLQRAGLVQYRRGKIVVADRAGLEARSCVCYMTAVTSAATVTGEPLG